MIIVSPLAFISLCQLHSFQPSISHCYLSALISLTLDSLCDGLEGHLPVKNGA